MAIVACMQGRRGRGSKLLARFAATIWEQTFWTLTHLPSVIVERRPPSAGCEEYPGGCRHRAVAGKRGREIQSSSNGERTCQRHQRMVRAAGSLLHPNSTLRHKSGCSAREQLPAQPRRAPPRAQPCPRRSQTLSVRARFNGRTLTSAQATA